MKISARSWGSEPIRKTVKNLDNPAVEMLSSKSIVVKNLAVQYRAVQALRDINLVIQPGRLVGIIGPNGAGKSTLLQAMLGLVPTSYGEAFYGSQPLSDQLSRVAYVPQRSQIDWTYPATVWDVVMMGRIRQTGWFRRFSAPSRQIAAAALERVGMSAYRHRPIGQLSGGQQQRVFLARSLAQEADIYCFDEPFVGIDQKTQDVIFEIFHELTAAGKLVLVINHDLGASITHFDDLILLNTEVIAHGPREQVLSRDYLDRAYGGRVVFYSGEAA